MLLIKCIVLRFLFLVFPLTWRPLIRRTIRDYWFLYLIIVFIIFTSDFTRGFRFIHLIWIYFLLNYWDDRNMLFFRGIISFYILWTLLIISSLFRLLFKFSCYLLLVIIRLNRGILVFKINRLRVFIKLIFFKGYNRLFATHYRVFLVF